MIPYIPVVDSGSGFSDFVLGAVIVAVCLVALVMWARGRK